MNTRALRKMNYMPLRFYDFRCKEGHLTERFIDSEETTTECAECHQEAKRIISGCSFKLDGTTGDFPGAAMKWAREHEKAAKQ